MTLKPGPFQSWLTQKGRAPPPTRIPACAGMTVCGFRDNGKALPKAPSPDS